MMKLHMQDMLLLEPAQMNGTQEQPITIYSVLKDLLDTSKFDSL